MKGFRVLVTLLVFVVGLSPVSSECKITERSSPHPYLVRIYKCKQWNSDWLLNTSLTPCFHNNTIAHGALVSADKVLTTCTGMTGPTFLGEVKFRLYSRQDGCKQERSSLQYFPHKNCEAGFIGSENLFGSDFALYIMDKPFDVEIKAILWEDQWGGVRPPKLSDMEAIIKKIKDSKPSCKAALFSNASAVDGGVEDDSSIDFINWDSCLSTIEKIFPVDDDPNDKPLRKIGPYRLSCGRDKKISGFKFHPPQQIGNDWHSGAAVVCDVDGKKVPIGLFSRIVAPAPYAKTPSFRVTVGFSRSFYDFLYDTAGIHPGNEIQPGNENPNEDKCRLSGENYYPYLMRIVKENHDPSPFEPVTTKGHGALIRSNMVLSSCTPYRQVPKNLNNERWMLWGYNQQKSCVQRRKPDAIYKPEECENAKENEVLVKDFAIWTTDHAFDLNSTVHHPNLWQGPNMPSIKEVMRSILEMSDDSYDGHISRPLSIGIFREPKLLTGDHQQNAQVEFITWDECKTQLVNFVTNWNGVEAEYVMDKQVYPVFCGIEEFRGTDRITNKSKADWISGAVVMYSYLYVFEWGEEPATVTIPLGVLSRVIAGQSKPDGKNIRVISSFSKSFYHFIRSTQTAVATQLTPKSSQPPCTTLDLRISALGIFVTVLGIGTRSIHH